MTPRSITFVVIGICLSAILACQPKAVPPEAMLDSPLRHVSNGNKLLAAQKYDAAHYEFSRAKELDPKSVAAHIGLGLVAGHRGDYTEGFKNLRNARWYALDSNRTIYDVRLGYMQLYLLGRQKIEKKWLDRIEQEFTKAKRLRPGAPEPFYYLGLAYKQAYRFTDARDQFQKIIDLNNRLLEAAEQELSLVQKIIVAMPGSANGKRIALTERINRADTAAIFIQELKIQELYTQHSPLKKPDKQTDGPAAAARLADVEHHPLKAEIYAVLDMGIEALQPFSDHTFRPDQIVTRAEYAMMIEDILVNLTGSDQLALQFAGARSPFPDLSNDQPYFNAVMICTSRGIMTTKNVRTGEFDPLWPISGVDALLGVRALKSQL